MSLPPSLVGARVETWQLEAHQVMVLTAAAEAWDRLQQTRTSLSRKVEVPGQNIARLLAALCAAAPAA